MKPPRPPPKSSLPYVFLGQSQGCQRSAASRWSRNSNGWNSEVRKPNSKKLDQLPELMTSYLCNWRTNFINFIITWYFEGNNMRFLMGMYTSYLQLTSSYRLSSQTSLKSTLITMRSEVFELPVDVDSLKTNEFIPESETMRLSFGWI